MELVQFFFGNFWHFVGLAIFITIVGDAIATVIRALVLLAEFFIVK